MPSREGIPMYVLDLRWRRLILATVVCLTCTRLVTASDEPTLTKESSILPDSDSRDMAWLGPQTSVRPRV